MTFALQSKTPLPDQDLEAMTYLRSCGLRHIHIPNDSSELSLVISVPTPTNENSGIPHILEHLIMSGSERYSQESPFFSMQGRTIAHEMNAVTDRGVTSYHFATTDAKDYENLFHLYMDLVLCPLLSREDFNREAWRLEIVDGTPKLNGVVLNEMLGAYGRPERHEYEAMVSIIGRGTPSEYLTGGHPLSIPSVDYENLKAFYAARYFHGNMVIVTSGNMSETVIQEWIEKNIANARQKTPSIYSKVLTEKNEGFGASPSETLKINPAGRIGKTPLLELSVPKNDETQKATWLWKGPYLSGSYHEIKDQFIIKQIFSDNNPALLSLKKKIERFVSGDEIFHPTARTGGNIGFYIQTDINDRHELEILDQAIEDFLEETIQAGISQESWKHMCNTLLGTHRKKTPMHSSAVAIGALAIENLPLDCDMNNLTSCKKLLREGAPNEKMLRKWFSRWTKQPILLSNPHPEMLNEWREALDEMAIVKAEHGNPSNVEIRRRDVPGNDNLPKINVNELNPKTARMSKIFDIPAGIAADQPHLSYEEVVLNFEKTTQLSDKNELATGIAVEKTPRHIHIEAGPDDKSSSLSVDFQIDGVEKNTLLALTCLRIMQNEIGKNGESLSASLADEMSMKISREMELTNNSTSSYEAHSIFKLYATPIDMSEQNPFLVGGILSLLNPTLSNKDELIQALTQGHTKIKSRMEDLVRSREKVKSIRLVDEAANRHIECSLDPGDILHFFEYGLKNQKWVVHQIESAIAAIKRCPRLIRTVGDAFIYEQGRALCKAFAGPVPSWTFNATTRTRDEGLEQKTSHIHQPGGGHTVERHFDFYGLCNESKKRLAAKLAAQLITPFLHEELREKGGSYGYSMSVRAHSLVLSSYRDPSPEAAYDVFDRVPEELLKMIEERDDTRLEEAKLTIAGQLVNPGDGLVGLRDAIFKIDNNLDLSPDFRNEQIKLLAEIGWDDIQEITAAIKAESHRSVNLTVGPQTPSLIQKTKAKTRNMA